MTSTSLDVRPHVADPYLRPACDVMRELGVDPHVGLASDVAAARAEVVGPNELAEAAPTAWWRRLVAQFAERLTLILLAAALLAFLVSGELKTPVVVLVVVVLNAAIGLLQERRAERSLHALRQMMVPTARVRRDGHALALAAAELVPGDVVLLEAGERVPADGRLVEAVALEVDESALTGESQPVSKDPSPVEGERVPLGDRRSMVFMNTTVTRGRGEIVVTATGMASEMGRIAALLQGAGDERTPLQRQLDRLAQSLAELAGLIVAAVVLIGLVRGQSLDELLLTAVALAVAAIPEGLPAVTAVTLAVGVSKMASRHAIIKRLASVETLGCTSVICTDKTGTLTLNQMTAVELVIGRRAAAITGRGYGPHGTIEGADDDAVVEDVMSVAALCNDAVVRRLGDEWVVVGDPTEGALVAAAGKAGIEVGALRRQRPRVGEIPFDAAHKFMATAHRRVGAAGVTLCVKGAPDALLERTTTMIDASGAARPLDVGGVRAAIDDMAARGLRVLGLARRHLDHVPDGRPIHDAVDELCLLGLVGIVDPPRPEVAAAIAEAHGAGMRVVMITGDHAATAGAIARQLGLHGDVMSGPTLDRIDDGELDRRLRTTVVFARVSPEHKLRLVEAFRRGGNIVAMTGDGVNDAPALKQADIGVAMGITGTAVTKEAATMILTDDYFATIVGAVRRGWATYDNIVTFVRFQLSTTVGFASLFLLAGLFGIAGGNPFTAIAILWVNLVMDGPPAIALGLDPPSRDVMARRPRATDEPILTRPRSVAIGFSALVMAVGTLGVLAAAPGPEPVAGAATVAGTMGFATFVLFQVFNALNTRSDDRSVFSRDSLRNRWLWLSLAVVLALQVAVTHLGPLQRLFDTTSLTWGQWAACAAVASSVLGLEELRKLVIRRRRRPTAAAVPVLQDR